MQPLERLNNEQKLRMFFDLVPNQLPNVTTTIIRICEQIESEGIEGLKQVWNMPIISPSFWYNMAMDTKKKMDSVTQKTNANTSKKFVDMFCSGMLAIFIIDCMGKHYDNLNTSKVTNEEKAKQLFNVLF